MTASASTLIKTAARQGLVPADAARLMLEEVRRSGDPQRQAEQLLIQGGHCSREEIGRLREEIAAAALATVPPAMIGGYRLQGRLGAGGMGEVFRAEQVSMHRLVALKLMSPELMRDSALGERFLREARAAGAINHPHVVGCYDAGVADGRYFMALEYVPGGDAERLMQEHGQRLGVRRALEIARDCARGLEALHQAGFIHRDIKPSNILLTEDGVAKIGDLGLVTGRASDDRLTRSGMAMGTPAYMSPEQADGELALDHASDVYALGASLFFLLTGHPPFTGKSAWAVVAKVINEPFPDPRRLNPDVSAGCTAVLLKATAKDRGQRYQTMREFRAAIEGLLVVDASQLTAATVAPAPGHRHAAVRSGDGWRAAMAPGAVGARSASAPAQPRSWPLLAIAGAAVLVMLVQVLWFFARPVGAAAGAPAVPLAPMARSDIPGMAAPVATGAATAPPPPSPPAVAAPPSPLPAAPAPGDAAAARWLQQPAGQAVVAGPAAPPPAPVPPAPTPGPAPAAQPPLAAGTGAGARQAPAAPVVAVLGCDPGDPSLREFARAFPELLTVALTRNGACELVERTQLSKVLNEQELTQSGAIDSANAARIGRLVGARILITQRVTALGDYIYISAKAIEVESGRVKAVSKGELRRSCTPALMAAMVAGDLGRMVQGWSGQSSGDSDEAKAVVAQLAQQLRGKRLPTVVIAVEESHMRLPAPDPAVRTELGYLLRKCGFRVIEGDSPALEAWAKSFAGGHAAAFPADLGAVQVVIAGSGVSEAVGAIGLQTSARARLELSAIAVGTGQVLGVERATVSAVDASDLLAGKTALEKAVRQVAAGFMTDVVNAWNQP